MLDVIVSDKQDSQFEYYGPEGHYLTSYAVGQLAGMSSEQASLFAYYSQAPDIFSDFDAVHNAKGAALGKMFDNITGTSVVGEALVEKMRVMQQELHSLLDLSETRLYVGDRAKLLNKERDFTRNALIKALSDGDIRAAGFLNHRLGDTYAHSKKVYGYASGKAEAFWVPYKTGLGHGFHGHDPDVIFNRPGRYLEYVQDLHSSLSQVFTPKFNTETVMHVFKALIGASTIKTDNWAEDSQHKFGAELHSYISYYNDTNAYLYDYSYKDGVYSSTIPNVPLTSTDFPSVNEQFSNEHYAHPLDSSSDTVLSSLDNALGYLRASRGGG